MSEFLKSLSFNIKHTSLKTLILFQNKLLELLWLYILYLRYDRFIKV
jgi:hypothetical protein